MNAVLSRRVSLIPARRLPTILSPTIGGATGDRPAASGFSPAPTGFVFSQQTRPRSPTESSSPCPRVSGPCYGLVVLVPLLPTPPRGDAVTVRYPTTPRRRRTDFHRSVFAPSQAHWSGSRGEPWRRVQRCDSSIRQARSIRLFRPLSAAGVLAARELPPSIGDATWKPARLACASTTGAMRGAKPKAEVVADILAGIRERRA